jgi:hypothetical protein
VPKSRAFAQIFREFYIMVVAYIYFTRIAVFIVQNTLPCRCGHPLTTYSYGLYSATPLIFQNTFRVPREVRASGGQSLTTLFDRSLTTAFYKSQS